MTAAEILQEVADRYVSPNIFGGLVPAMLAALEAEGIVLARRTHESDGLCPGNSKRFYPLPGDEACPGRLVELEPTTESETT